MKKDAHRALLVKVFCELGRGDVWEEFIPSTKTEYVDGLTTRLVVRRKDTGKAVYDRTHVTVNPVRSTLDTLVHELLHRLFPKWKENYVRRTTSYLLKRMSDEELQVLYGEYQKRAKKAIKTA